MRTMVMLVMLCVLMVCLVAGCATGTLESTKVLADGTKIPYKVTVTTIFQDFKGSDLSASLDPDGKTTLKAGAVDNTTNALAADAMKSLTDLIKEMLPYLVKAAAVTP